MKPIAAFLLISVLLTACIPQATAAPTPLPSATPMPTSVASATPLPPASPTPEPTKVPDDWPFPDDPVVETLKLSEDEMKENNPEFYNEVAPILSGSGIVVEQWMQHPDTGEVFMLVHHKDGGGQFMMTDYEYSNGHVLFGFNTRETEIAMENKWLQPVDDGRLLAITLQNAPDGKTMNSLFMDLAGMAHLRNRVGMGNLPETLEKMKAAIANERAHLGNDRINFVYLLTMFEGGETLVSNPFPEMHTFLGSSGPGDYVKTDMILIKNVDGSLIVMNGMHINRSYIRPTATFLRGEETIARVENNEELKNKFARMPELPNYLIMDGMYGHILGTTIANLGEESMELSALAMYSNKFLAEPIFTPDYSLVDVPIDSLNAYFRKETDNLPEKYVQNLIKWVNHIFIRNQLVK